MVNEEVEEEPRNPSFLYVRYPGRPCLYLIFLVLTAGPKAPAPLLRPGVLNRDLPSPARLFRQSDTGLEGGEGSPASDSKGRWYTVLHGPGREFS